MHQAWRVAGASAETALTNALMNALTDVKSANLAADAVLFGARGFGHNDFKMSLLRRTLRAVITEITDA